MIEWAGIFSRGKGRLHWVLLLIVGVSTACTDSPSDPVGSESPDDTNCTLVEEGYGPPGQVRVNVEVVTDGLEVPWGIAFLPEGDMLVTERPGRLRLVRNGMLQPQPVADVTIAAGGEGGLLGITLHPDFENNRLFYLYYTHRAEGSAFNRVEEWILSENGSTASAVRVILDSIPAARFHNGGRIRFGPDGMLYIGTGDAGNPSRAQNGSELAGKVLRLTADGEIPPDNPEPGSPVYISGVRNTQAFDWMDTSTMWIADHGPSGEMGRSGHDEVSVASGGDNLGWPTLYGCQDAPSMVAPVLTWRSAVPPGGASVYTGSQIPEWEGSLLVGTLRSRHLHRITINPDTGMLEEHDVYFQGDPPDGYGRLRDVIMGPDGALYITTSNCDGRGSCPSEGDKILRITG